MHSTGLLNQSYEEIDDVSRARGLPSPQLVGSHDAPILDLNRLSDNGVKVVGRLMGINNGTAQFSGSLRNVCALADLKMRRLLEAIDDWIEHNPVLCDAPERFEPTRVDDNPSLLLDLENSNVRTIIWATGFRPDYSWLDVPVLEHSTRRRRGRYAWNVRARPADAATPKVQLYSWYRGRRP
jgi:putative flavoprotein involved in K+ transport